MNASLDLEKVGEIYVQYMKTVYGRIPCECCKCPCLNGRQVCHYGVNAGLPVTGPTSITDWIESIANASAYFFKGTKLYLN